MSRLHDIERKLDEKIRGALRSRGESDYNPELFEVHRAIVEEVLSRADVLPRGKRKWSYPRVEIRVVAPEQRRRSYEIALIEGDALQREIRARLEEDEVEVPQRFQVDVELVDALPEELRSKGFDISYRDEVAPTAQASCAITVLSGVAEQSTYRFKEKRINLGRLPEVLDGEQQFVRRNDIALTDDGDPINASVSRQHAHLVFDSESGWRLFDDHSKSGTTVLRQGEVLKVPAGSARGMALKSGDEIRLGKARLRFD